MDSSSVPSSIVSSSIKALNAGISSHNPFIDASTVREPDVWMNRSADSPHLNVAARSHLHTAYGRICRGDAVAAVTLLGQTGTGKTHELNSFRQHVHTAATPGLFVYLNVQQFSEGQAVRQQFLRAIGDSLVRRMPNGLLQWQQLAIALANHGLSGIDNSRKQFAPRSVLELLSRNSLEQNQAWIDRIAEAFFRVRPDIDDPDMVRAIFWTLCPHQLPYARKWLSGLTIPTWKRHELGLPQARTHNLESYAWQTTLNLLVIAEQYAPVTIAFDCFEHPEIPDPAVQKERVAVGLIKWLGDRLRTRTRRFGVLFVCAMHPDTWELAEDHFGAVVQFAHDRGEPIHLQPADAATIEQAIQCWLQTFYQARNLVPPTPLYPFDRAQVAALVRESVDLHDAIEWCADNFQPVETDPLEPIELRFNAILRELVNEGLGDDWIISQAIGQMFAQLKGCELTIENLFTATVDSSDPASPPDSETSSSTSSSPAAGSGESPASVISFQVHDVTLCPQSPTFPVTIALEILDIAPPAIPTTLHTPAASPLASPPEPSEPSHLFPHDDHPDPAHFTVSPNSAELQTTLPRILHLGLGALTSTNGRQLCAQINRCLRAIEPDTVAASSSTSLPTSRPTDQGAIPQTQNQTQNQTATLTQSTWTLGCLVRPRGASIPAHWKAAQSYQRFAQHDRGLVIEFSLDDIAPLLALTRLEAEIADRERSSVGSPPQSPMTDSSNSAHAHETPCRTQHTSEAQTLVDLDDEGTALMVHCVPEEEQPETTERGSLTDSVESTIGVNNVNNTNGSSTSGSSTNRPGHDLELGVEPPRTDRPIGTDPIEAETVSPPLEQTDSPEPVEPTKHLEYKDQTEPEDQHDAPDMADLEPLPLTLNNNRLSRFPSAKPVRDVVLTRELLAAWIDRENIAIDNLIICTLIGRAVADIVQGSRSTPITPEGHNP